MHRSCGVRPRVSKATKTVINGKKYENQCYRFHEIVRCSCRSSSGRRKREKLHSIWFFKMIERQFSRRRLRVPASVAINLLPRLSPLLSPLLRSSGVVFPIGSVPLPFPGLVDTVSFGRTVLPRRSWGVGLSSGRRGWLPSRELPWEWLETVELGIRTKVSLLEILILEKSWTLVEMSSKRCK